MICFPSQIHKLWIIWIIRFVEETVHESKWKRRAPKSNWNNFCQNIFQVINSPLTIWSNISFSLWKGEQSSLCYNVNIIRKLVITSPSVFFHHSAPLITHKPPTMVLRPAVRPGVRGVGNHQFVTNIRSEYSQWETVLLCNDVSHWLAQA